MKNVSYYRHLYPECLKKLVAITKITAVSRFYIVNFVAIKNIAGTIEMNDGQKIISAICSISATVTPMQSRYVQ